MIFNNFTFRVFSKFITFFEYITRKINHKGFYNLSSWLGRLIPNNLKGTANLTPNIKYKFQLNDPYWNRILAPNYHYESEILFFMSQTLKFDFAFIDCGANLGYWSLLFSSEKYKERKCFSIEPVSPTFNMLCENIRINKKEQKIIPIKKAISNRSGLNVKISYEKTNKSRANASIKNEEVKAENSSRLIELVETISIDDIIEEYNITNSNLVIKLDVEGQEINAILGLEKCLIEKDFILIYEDHGNEKESTVTKFILSKDLLIFYVDEKKNISQVFSIEQLRGIKIKTSKGYNFFAIKPESNFLSIFTS